jgi:hypothetical protein
MRLLVLFAVTLALAACEEGPKTYSYVAPETPGGRMCANQCRLASDYCQETCDIPYRSCVSDVQAQALQDYAKYTREQFDASQPMDLYLSDFERMQPCTAARDSCNHRCENDYGMCYGNCGGTVKENPSCQFLCF